MADRKVYRVQYISESRHVRHNDASLSTHEVKDDAVAEGQRVAKANAPSQLVVHRKDGTFEYEYTYEDDPYPPKG
jgi:hypothetical protein